jgi:glycosyltransferase involved in cell wall biosynthesis
MRIAVWHNLPSGGGKRALYNHVKGLVKRGHVVESWCPPTADQTYLPLSNLIKEHIVPLNQLYVSPFRKIAFEASEILYKESNKPLNLISRIRRRLAGILYPYPDIEDRMIAMHLHCQQCADQINHGGFDLLFANSCWFFYAPAIGQYVNIPKAVYLGEPNRSFYEASPQLPWLALPQPNQWFSPQYLADFWQDLVEVQKLRAQAREELKNIQAFDLILVNSIFSTESVQRAYGLDSQVCYLGIDSELFKPLNLPRQQMVVGLGAMLKAKGLDKAVRAIATIASKLRPTLIWIGNMSDATYVDEVKKLAIALGVNFVPKLKIPDSEVIELLNQAAVMIYTSTLEPFGFAPLEANACETPVVAIAQGGVKESIQDGVNGFLIQGNDPVAIGQAIAKILNDPELSDRLGKQARNHVLDYWSWDRAIDRLEQSLRSLIKET